MVFCNASSKSQQVTSLRKKNLNILIGEAYRDAVKCSETAKADKLPNMFANTQKTHYQSTENVFRCAYLLAKLNRLYSHMSYYVQLNELNNADVGVTLHSQKSASEIIATISNEMKKKLVSSHSPGRLSCVHQVTYHRLRPLVQQSLIHCGPL